MKSITFTRLFLALLLVASSGFWTSCADADYDTPYWYQPDQSAKLPQQWMQETYNTVKREGLFALDASRLYAYTAIAMYESMVHALPGYRSLSGQLHGLEALPQPEPGRSYDWGIVICHTVPQVMKAIQPGLSNTSIASHAQLAQSQEQILVQDRNLTTSTIQDSKDFADLLADAIIAWAATDNRIGMEDLVYTPPAYEPQHWKGSTLGQTFMMPFWWTSRTFVIPTYRQCEPEPPYTYSTDPNSAYYKDVEEVYNASFDPAKVDIGRYWANNPGLSGSPAGSWIGIANQLVDQYNLDLPTTLRMYVLLSVSTRDAFIAAWYTKYKYNLERPVTYIRDVMGHTNWNSPVPTPPYPDYISGTSINAGSSSEILTELFGFKAFEDGQHADKGFGVRSFSNFKEAGIQAYNSRVFGGVHMRKACAKGFEQGECLAQHLMNNLEFEVR
ncbi:MAG: vanadium-dependent haloperoxidase [Saprospiraceae bacterium]|nr:vanadium-dependent haloperoxidase [Saprospiraceae bacterium]